MWCSIPRSDEEITYNLVTSEEADAANGKISTTSPIGRALLGKEVGDVVESAEPRRGQRTGNPEAHHHPRCSWLKYDFYPRDRCRSVGAIIDHIVRWLALSKIHPNVLTFFGLLINIWAAWLFRAGRRSRDSLGRRWWSSAPDCSIWWMAGWLALPAR